MKIFLIVAFILALTIGTGFLFLYGFETIANYIPVPVSVGCFSFGLVSYITGSILLRKKYVYHRDSTNQIRLDTPSFSDYSYITGVICMVIGVVTFQPIMSGLSEAWLLFSILALAAVFKLVFMFIRLKHAVHDKIVVNSNWIQLDDPLSSKSNTYNRESINKIVYLKTFESGRFGYSSAKYSMTLALHILEKEGGDVVEVGVEPENMNLKMNYVIDALKEMNYEITNISKKNLSGEEWEGHEFR